MKTPVLIAARNEAEHIETTLAHLHESVEPIVIANGCTDDTAELAYSAGATVLESPIEGKLPAIQFGLKYLGERALQPVLMLDADAHPLTAKYWAQGMLRARGHLDPNQPAAVIGPLLLTTSDLISTAWRNFGHTREQLRTRHDPKLGSFCGRNMLFDLRNEATLADVLDMPHIWPREDSALKDVVINNNGAVIKSFNPGAYVFAVEERYPGLITRVRKGGQYCYDVIMDSYEEDAAPGSIPYWLDNKGEVIAPEPAEQILEPAPEPPKHLSHLR